MGFFKKDRRVFGMSFLARMVVAVLVVVSVGVSGSVLMAGYVDDSGENSSNVLWTNNNCSIEINKDGPFPDYAFIDFHGDDTYTDYSFRIIRSNTGADAYSMIQHRGTGPFYLYTTDSAPLIFVTNSSARMRVDSNGNVGIGTTAPNAKLEINDNDGIDHFRLRNSGNGAFWNLDVQNTAQQVGNLRFKCGSGTDNDKVIFRSDGNVGIGTTNPNAKLHVEGKVSATQYACTSDSRFKKNISLYQNALEKILGLCGVTFFWNTEKYKDRNFSKERQIGFIAQEVEKVIPEIVYTDDRGFKTMSYDRLTAVLVEAVKELKAEKDGEIALMKKDYDDKIVKLESENETLKADNVELKQKLVKLDSVIDRLALLERKMEKQEGLSLAER